MRTALLSSIALLAALAPGAARADVDIRIGAGGGCSPAGNNIQAAINAADPALGVTNILIARNATYTAQQLDIAGKNVRLTGGYANCVQTTADSTRTVISGQGGGSNSVITIRGSTSRVELRNLDITAGDEVTGSNGFGGGIDISGGPHPFVYLENVRVQNSSAGLGGGISVKNGTPSNQNAVALYLSRNNVIAQNMAGQRGGGIYCADSRIEIVGSNNAINGNGAGSGGGGGMRLENCNVLLASRSLFLGTVSFNATTGPGGGISITGERARLTMFNLVPDAPTLVSNNTADGVGGGIDIGSSAKVHGFDIAIEGNTSRSGGGGVAVFDNDGEDFADRAELLMQGTLNGAPPGAVNCAAALDCNRISDNIARNSSGVDQGGAALRVFGVHDPGVPGEYGYAESRMYGTRIARNSGHSVVHLPDGGGISRFDGVLFDGNTASAHLLHNASEGDVEIFGSTIARNTVSGALIRTDDDALLKRSLVWQPGVALFSLVGNSLHAGSVEHVLSSSFANAPASPTNRLVNQSEIAFVDFAAGNLRLQAGSVALDYAPAAAGHTRDRFARNVDIEQEANQFGSQDVGAYEKQAADGYNSAPVIEVAGSMETFEDLGGEVFLQGFSLSDPDGDIDGALYVTAPPGTGFIDGLYFAGVTATQLAPNRIVIEGPLARITQDTATFAGATRYLPAVNFFGDVPIALELNDQGHSGVGGVLTTQATLVVTVLPVNDRPTLQVPDLLRAASATGMQTVELAPSSTISVGPANESGQFVQGWSQLSVQDTQGVLSGVPQLGADGKLQFALSGTVGIVTFSARITDSGGTANGGVDTSAPATFHLRVGAGGAELFSDGFEE